MSLFRKKTADEMQEKMIELIQDYKESVNIRNNHQQKAKSSNTKLQVGMAVMAGSGIGIMGTLVAVSAGVMAAPLTVPVLTGTVVLGYAALGYTALHKLIKNHHEGILRKNDADDVAYKAGNTFERKINALISKTEGLTALNSNDMYKLKSAVLNDNGTSMDNALREINLPDTKHKKVFKENISGQMEESLERIMPKSFYSTKKESLKTGLGLTVAMGGAIAAVGGISAASLMVTGLGVIASAGALTWGGIRLAAEAIENRQIKKHFTNKNDEDVGTKKAKLSI